MVAAFGHPDCIERRGVRLHHHYGVRVGKAHILACAYHHPAEDEARVFAGINHLGQPVQGCVGVRAPEGLYECADHVEMIVAFLVIEHGLALDAFLSGLLGYVDLVAVTG